MKVVQVNTGPLQPFSVQGDILQTGFFKTPKKGPVRIFTMGLEGDKRLYANGNPNRAVFFYQAHYYEYWRNELKQEFPYSMFGENITFEGWGDEEFCLGDELQLGTARVRITQPRHPCIKIGERVGDPTFPYKYMKALKLGFHCAVVEEGEVEEGDEIRLLHRVKEPLKLHDFTIPVFVDTKDTAGLERILACPEVPAELKIYVERVWNKSSGKLGGWREYRPLTVTNHRTECKDVVSFDLSCAAGEELPDFEAGQFLTMQFDIPGQERLAVRTYTIAGRTEDGKGYSFTIKREVREDGTSGLVSSHLVDSIKNGAIINSLPPRGNFIIEPATRPIVLLSAGIGVTPILAMLEQLRHDKLDRQVICMHGARSGEEHIHGEYVRELSRLNERITSFVKYSQPTDQDVKDKKADSFGRLDVADVRHLINDLEADFYVCGPGSFIKYFVPALVSEGVPKERIKFEFFGNAVSLFESGADISPGDPVFDSDGKPIIVTFAKAGVSVPWTSNTPSILVLAERNGVHPPQLCRSGLCEACICRLDSGEVRYEVDILSPLTQHEVMICCAKPTTSVMVDA